MTDIHLDQRTASMQHHLGRTALVILCSLLSLTGIQAHATSDPETPKSSAMALTAGEHRQITEVMTKEYGNPLTITPADFRSDGVNPGGLIHKWPDDALWGSDANNVFAVAPVYLPDGATIASVGVEVYDGFEGATGPCSTTTHHNVRGYLLRVNNYTGEQQQLSFFSTTGLEPDRQYFLDTEVEYPDIQYPQYSYYAAVKICHSAHFFYAMQIFFSML